MSHPSVPDDSPRVRVERAGGIGRIVLARPEKKNALDRLTAESLAHALQDLGGDDDVRAIALSGDGDDFCAGADLEALERMLDADEEVHRRDALALGRVFAAMRQIAKPVVAVVRGRALAGGAGLATACDIVLAHEGAQFGYPEVRIGFVPAMVMTMLRRVAGERAAADLVLTGRIVDAREALRIGLVSRVLPAATFDADVDAVLAGLAKSPRTAMAMTKRLLYAIDGVSFAEALEDGVDTNVEARATHDFREGVRSFVARRRDA